MLCDSSFVFHSHSVSIGRVFGLSFAHQRLSNRHRPYFFIYVVAENAISFEKLPWQLLSVCSFRLLCCKIFVLKYFRRMSTLRKFFNTKIFLTKISYNENFPIYGNHFTTIGALFMCLIVGKVPIQLVYRHHFAGYLIF